MRFSVINLKHHRSLPLLQTFSLQMTCGVWYRIAFGNTKRLKGKWQRGVGNCVWIPFPAQLCHCLCVYTQIYFNFTNLFDFDPCNI